MATLTQAHTQWANRPADERFTSLDDMLVYTREQRRLSDTGTIFNKSISVAPVEDNPKGIAVIMNNEETTAPSHWAFNQLCQLVGAPASYMRTLPSDLVSDCLNQSMAQRKTDQVGWMIKNDGFSELKAVTGPTYGRIWNSDVVDALIRYFGTGPDAQFTVPGEYGREVTVTKDNTTLFAGDRDMFVFLADEKNRIEFPDRRDGQSGEMARGFFVQNSEVGSSTLKIGTFLFDYVCANRIVWGAEGYKEVSIRHSLNAPHRWVNEIMPALESLQTASTHSIVNAVNQAKSIRLDEEQVDAVLVKRFTKNQANAIKLAHSADEGRPMRSPWDIVTGATAYARGLKNQDDRVAVERIAGSILAAA